MIRLGHNALFLLANRKWNLFSHWLKKSCPTDRPTDTTVPRSPMHLQCIGLNNNFLYWQSDECPIIYKRINLNSNHYNKHDWPEYFSYIVTASRMFLHLHNVWDGICVATEECSVARKLPVTGGTMTTVECGDGTFYPWPFWAANTVRLPL